MLCFRCYFQVDVQYIEFFDVTSFDVLHIKTWMHGNICGCVVKSNSMSKFRSHNSIDVQDIELFDVLYSTLWTSKFRRTALSVVNALDPVDHDLQRPRTVAV